MPPEAVAVLTEVQVCVLPRHGCRNGNAWPDTLRALNVFNSICQLHIRCHFMHVARGAVHIIMRRKQSSALGGRLGL
jgi:hypothetical protein